MEMNNDLDREILPVLEYDDLVFERVQTTPDDTVTDLIKQVD